MTASFPNSTPTTAQLRGDIGDNVATLLSAAIGAGDVTIPVDDASEFPSAGLASLKKANATGIIEVIAYTGKTANSLTGVTRDFNGKGSQAYSEDDEVHLYWVADHHNRHVEETIAIAGNLITRFGTGADVTIDVGVNRYFTGQTWFDRYSDTATDDPVIRFLRTRGTRSAQTTVVNADELAKVEISAKYGTAIYSQGWFQWEADGTVTEGVSHPCRFRLFTTPDGSTTAVESLRIEGAYLMAQNGDAARPAYQCVNATGSGMWFDGVKVAFSAAGSKIADFSSGGLEMNGSRRFFGPNGSAGSPTYTFSNYTTTGIYIDSANSIGFALNGSGPIVFQPAAAFFSLQIRGYNGSAASPSYSFSSFTNYGMYATSGFLWLVQGGNAGLMISGTQTNLYGGGAGTGVIAYTDSTGLKLQLDGTSTNNAIAWAGDNNTGFYHSADTIHAATGGGIRQSWSNGATYFRNAACLGIDGAYNAPTWSFENDTDIGMFRPAANNLGLSVPTNGNIAFYENNVIAFRYDGGGDIITADGKTTKTVDLGSSVRAWDDVWADDFQNVADIPFFDHRKDKEGKIYDIDDMQIVRDIKPLRDKRGNLKFNENGFAYWDDNTLPEWLWTRKRWKKNKVPGPLVIARDSDGKPWIAMKVLAGLALGVGTALVRRTDDHELRIRQLENQILELKGAA